MKTDEYPSDADQASHYDLLDFGKNNTYPGNLSGHYDNKLIQ